MSGSYMAGLQKKQNTATVNGNVGYSECNNQLMLLCIICYGSLFLAPVVSCFAAEFID